MSRLDEYLGRVQATVWLASDYVSAGGLNEAQRLIDHGEPAEGIAVLAWVIVNEDVQVPARVIRDIRELSADLVEAEDLPPGLDEHGRGHE